MGWEYSAGETISIVSGACLALGVLATTIINAISTAKLRKETSHFVEVADTIKQNTDHVSYKTDEVVGKLDVIHEHTNSKMTLIEGRLKDALDQLALRDKELQAKEKTRVDLANEAARTIERAVDKAVDVVRPVITEDKPRVTER